MRLSDLAGRVFAALSARLTPADPAPLAVALSGGGDSTALIGLAAAWGRANGRRLVAFTVDHGLNPESAAWTEAAGAVAARAGADWRALRWEGPRPAAGLPAAARAARHRLIADAARAAGAAVVLFGHTADDVAEARLMRAEGSTTPEPKPWAPSPAWPEGRGLFILRPMLGERREALRAWLRGRGEGWLEDPANDDPRFARARARRDLAAGGGVTALRPDAAPPPPLGLAATADGRILGPCAVAAAAGEGLLARAAVCAAGTVATPGRAQLLRLRERIAAGEPFVASLAGARIEGDGETVAFARNAGERARGALAPLSLDRGQTAVWDGRFAVCAEAPGRIVPAAGRLAQLSPRDRSALGSLPARAREAFPLFVDRQNRPALPRPFGEAPVRADCLVGARFAAACGWIQQERDIRTRPVQ